MRKIYAAISKAFDKVITFNRCYDFLKVRFPNRILVAFFVLSAFALSEQGLGQAASSTWTLTSSATPGVTGNVTATVPTFGGGITQVLPQYDATFGAQATGWSTVTTFNSGPPPPNNTPSTSTQYIQFTVTPTAGNTLTITSLSTSVQVTQSNDRMAIYYSTDPTFATSTVVQNPINMGVANPFNYPNSTLSAIANPGQTLYFRVFFFNATSAAKIGIRSFVLSGTTSAPVSSITTGAISGSPFCTGATVSVPFTSVGTYTTNTYTAQLSDAAGNFGAPTNIGTLGSNLNSGTISATIPVATPAGAGYRIRVISNSPAVTGSNNGTNITITALPVATFSYAGTPYCQNAANPSPTFSGGGVAGTFTSTAGLVFVSAATGQINLSASTPGTYTVTNTIAASGGCAAVTATSSVTITALPVATFSYAGTPYCQNAANPSPTFSGGGVAGTFTAPAALSINSATGQINLSASTPGTYTVTNTIAASGGCGVVTATSSVTITALPVATFSYAGTPYCQNAANPSPTFSGGGVAGTFTSTAGLVFVSAATGQINLSASAPGTYTVTNTIPASGGCAVVTATSSVTITALPVATFSYTGTPYCQNGTNPSPTFSGGGVAGTFTSTAGLVFVSATTGQIDLSASTAGTYTVTNTIAASVGCALVTATSTVTINQPVVITADPGPLTQTVCATSTVIYTVSATGSGLTYQWLKNGSPIINGGNISGATSANLQIAGATLSDNGDYSVTVSGLSPCTSATSATATLVVDQRIIFTAQPVSPSTICQGQPYTISASATGTVNTSVWNKGGVFYANAVYDGVNTYSLTIPAVVAGDAGNYQLVLDDGTGIGCTSANSNTAVLNVSPSSVGGTVSSDATVCSGTNNGTLTLSGQTGNVTRWESSVDGGTSWSPIVNATTSQTYSNLTQTTQYRAVVVSGACPPVNSSFATITVSQIPTTSNAGPAQTLCSTTTNTTLAANTPVNGTGTWSVTSGPSTLASQFSDVTNPTATFTPAVTTAGTYVLTWTISNGPCTASSSSVNIVVNTAPTISSQPANQTTCSGTAKTFSVTAAGTSPTYQWQYSADNTTWTNVANGTPANVTYANGTTNILTVTPAAAAVNGTYYYRCQVSVTGCSVLNSSSATLTVSATPTTSVAGPAQTLCSTTTNTTLAANTPVNGTGTWSVTSGPSTLASQFSNINSPTATFTPAVTTAGTYVLTWTISNGPCTASSSSVNIVVNTAPTISSQPANQTTCSGTSKTFSVTAGGTSPTYQWQYSADNITWTNVANGAPANVTYANSATNTLTVTPAAAAVNGTYYYRCVVSVAGCSSLNSSSATLTVSATPTTATVGGTQTICNGGTATLTGNTPTNGTGTWSFVSGPSTALTQISNVNTPAATFTPAGGAGNYVFRWTISNGPCTSSNSPNLTITVNAPPNISGQPANQTTCAGLAKTFSVTLSSGTSPTYQWQYSADNSTWNNVANGTPINITYTNSTTATLNVIPGAASGDGTYYYRCVVTVAGCATLNSASATLTVSATPTTANAGPNQTICSTTASTTLAANTPTAGTGIWSIISGPNTQLSQFSNINSPASTFTPAGGAGIYALRWTISNGTCTASTSNVNVTVNTAPSISSQPANQTTCAGTFVNFSVTAGGSSPSYQWQYSADNITWGNVVNGIPANITYSNSTTASVRVTPSAAAAAGTYYYRCIVTVAGCASPVTSNSATLIVNINSTMVLTSAPGTDGQTVCNVTPITNITYNVGGGATGVNQTGSFPPGVTGSLSAGVYTISGTPTTSGTYNYTLTTTGPCTQVARTGQIIVTAAPTGTLTATETSGTANNDNIICTGATVNFTATAGFSLYKFYKIDAANDTTVVQNTNTNNIYSSNTLNDKDTILVQVFNNLSCASYFNKIVITVNPLPTPTLSVDKPVICDGDTVTFTATGGATYNFKVNGSSQQSGASASFSTSTLVNGDVVTVDATNGNKCTATSTPITMVVNAIPNGNLTASATTVCVGTSITFTATGGTQYQFRVNGTIAQAFSGTNTFTSSSIPNGAVVTVDVSNAAGCTTTYLPGIAITVNPAPAGTIIATENSGTPNDGIICAGSPVTFTFSQTGYSIYNFKINGVSKQSSSSAIFTTNALATGDAVTVDITSGAGCTGTFSAPVITVVGSPVGSLSVSANPVCAGSTVTFTATPLDATFNYQFLVNGNPVQNGATNTYTTTAISDNDQVTVEVTNSNGCVDTFNIIKMTVNPMPSGTMVPVENSGLTANDGIICAGATVVFTPPATFSNYNFILNGVSVQNGAGKTYSNNTLTNGDKIDVSVTGAGGCIGLLNQVVITVNPLPVISPITGPGSVCVNGTIALSDNDVPGTWSSLNTTIATVDASGVVTGKSPGTATIDYTFTNGNGCSSTVSKTITVNTPPVVAPITGNFNVCTSNTSQLNDATAGGVWSSGSTGVATVDNTGLVTGVAPGTAIISYSFTDGNGCTTVVTGNVTVNDLPQVANITTASPDGFNVCKSGTLSLADATPGGVWSSNDLSTATVSPSGVVTGVGSGTVQISYTITTTCSQTAASIAVINVNTPPSATISYPGSPFCTSSGTIAVTQTGTPGGTYSALPSGLTINPANGTITPSSSTGGTYTVTYTLPASGGCGVYTTTTSVTITTAPSATISYAGPYCTSSAPVNVTRTGTAGGSYTSSPAGLTIDGTSGVITPSSSTAGTYTVTYTIAAANGCAAFSTTATVIITAAPSGTISYAGGPFCTSSGVVNVTSTVVAGGIYSYTGAGTLILNTSTGAITPATSTGATYTVAYTVSASGGCAAYSTSAMVTIIPAPVSVAGTAVSTCANTGAVNITAGASASNQSSVQWSSSGTGSFANGNSLTAATYTPSGADISAGSVTLTLTANGNAPCSNAVSTKVLTISAPPTSFIITPASANICSGVVQPLYASLTPPTTKTVSFPSGNINLAIPDNSASGRTSNINVNGIPAGAIINSVSVTFNVNHGYDQELVMNLKGPNGNVLNLVNQQGGSGSNFTNTTISSATNTPINGNAPFNGTYSPDSAINVGATGQVSNVSSFSRLYGVPNGNWTFSARDLVGCRGSFAGFCYDGPYTGTIINWTITINYTDVGSPVLVNWSPVTNLFTDPGATTAYAGQNLSTVYVQSNAAITTTYSATATNSSNCSTTQTVPVTINPKPNVTITPGYCTVPKKVRLTANSVPAATSYLWNTGETTQSIDVDVAGTFTVTVFSGGTCPGRATVNVATELVTNGNFSNGNDGSFTSDYNYKPDLPGLVPPGQGELWDDTGNNGYSITPSGQNVHYNFWGHDHTTGDGNFMAVNGHGSTLIIWKQTVNVLPNTTYYFSAWAMSMNSAGNNAQLRFSVNGTLVGNTAVLANHGQSAGAPDNWVRFYGSWMSGPTTTTADIFINDLQSALTGNDFGLDDISFGTLSTFVTLESAPGSDTQVVCKNTPIANIIYSVGNGNNSGPTVTGLPAGVTSLFSGDRVTISGTPTAVAGKYTYTITTTGCVPQSVTGTITVQEQTMTLTSGSSSTSVCVNTPVNISYTLSGTATSANVTGLPTGVTASGFPVVTISGTSAVAGIYPYKIISSGTCTPDTLTGTITFKEPTIVLLSVPSSASQTVCINTGISNIQYTIGGTATGATAVGLPAGVSGTYSGAIFTISGIPTASGLFSYTVTTTGTCGTANATGTINVTPAAAIALSSAPGTDAQTACNNLPITSITYNVTNATGASITSGALPAGVTGSYNAGVFTISGTPTVGGTFNYTVTTSGGCATASASGTITLNAQKVVLTSGNATPTVCQGSPMGSIVYTISGAATGATASGLPAGVTGNLVGNTFTLSGIPTDVAGAYMYTVTTSGPTCTATTLSGTITVQATAVGGSLVSTSTCSGGSGILTLSGQSGGIVQWESSTDGGTTWTVIPNNTISYNYSNITVPTMFRVKVSNGCGFVYSSTATVSIHNYWTGGTSTDWNTASNWSDGTVPNGTCSDVYIPGGTPNEPLISTGTVSIGNLHIATGGALTVDNATLQISGTINNAAGTFITASNGTIEMNGAAAQTIPASAFLANKVKSLIISNTGSGVTLGGPVSIYESLTYGASGSTLNTAGFLTLKSSATQTAWIGDMTNHNINGNVTVERYINIAGGGHAKAWEFLGVPTKGQTLKQSWMENGSLASTGFGTQVTGAAGLGFDQTSPAPSVKYYDPTNSSGWTGIASAGTSLYDARGYMVFVRGDRSVDGIINTTANPTTLRSSGTLLQGTQTIPVAANAFASVGNPFAAALDMRKVLSGNSVGVNEFFTLWNSNLGGAYGYGVYQTYSLNPGNGNYESTPGPVTNNFIQSGEAFFVQATAAAGNVTIKETSKANVSGGFMTIFRPQGTSGRVAQLRTNLYAINAAGSKILADGTLQQFSDDYSNAIDGMDARKFFNISENLSIKSGGKDIIIERRHTPNAEDTVFYNLTRVKIQNYQFEFIANNLSSTGLEGFVEDTYLKTRTPLNLEGNTEFNFAVTSVPASYAANRFRIVYKTAVALPVTFVSVKAYVKNTDIAVEWNVENESNMQQYEVEKSIDGSRFNKVATIAAANLGAGSYNWLDQNATAGYNYYRIRSMDLSGKANYTQTVKVLMQSIVPDIRIYPNPITNGVINLQLINQPAGTYGIRLLNPLGQLIVSKQVTREQGSNTEQIKWNYNLAHGTYQLEVIKPNGEVKVIKVMY